MRTIISQGISWMGTCARRHSVWFLELVRGRGQALQGAQEHRAVHWHTPLRSHPGKHRSGLAPPDQELHPNPSVGLLNQLTRYNLTWATDSSPIAGCP